MRDLTLEWNGCRYYNPITLLHATGSTGNTGTV